MIQHAIGCKEDYADFLRRQLSSSKKKEKAIQIIKKMYFQRKGGQDINIYQVLDKLKGLQKYSFCKSHAYSYAQLVWYIAYMKANYPVLFWKATLNHCHSSYRQWVHRYEAYLHGVDWKDYTLSVNDRSIFSQSKHKHRESVICNTDVSDAIKLKKTGSWNMIHTQFYPGCYGFIKNNTYLFRGIIASMRIYRSGSSILFLGIAPHIYIELNLGKKYIHFIKRDIVGLKGRGMIKKTTPIVIDVEYITTF